MSNVAGYLYEEAKFGAVAFSAGARYDSRTLDVETTEELNVQAQRRTYDALTGTIGASYRLSEPFAVGVNIGTGWRSPSAFELFVDGVHEGTIQYLIGDPALGNERSVNADVSLRYASGRTPGRAHRLPERDHGVHLHQPHRRDRHRVRLPEVPTEAGRRSADRGGIFHSGAGGLLAGPHRRIRFHACEQRGNGPTAPAHPARAGSGPGPGSWRRPGRSC